MTKTYYNLNFLLNKMSYVFRLQFVHILLTGFPANLTQAMFAKERMGDPVKVIVLEIPDPVPRLKKRAKGELLGYWATFTFFLGHTVISPELWDY